MLAELQMPEDTLYMAAARYIEHCHETLMSILESYASDPQNAYIDSRAYKLDIEYVSTSMAEGDVGLHACLYIDAGQEQG